MRRGASGTAACPFLTEIWIFEIKKKTGVFETIGMEILQDNTIKSTQVAKYLHNDVTSTSTEYKYL